MLAWHGKVEESEKEESEKEIEGLGWINSFNTG